MKLLCLFLLIAQVSHIRTVYGWWDEGHMLVGIIAKTKMSSDATKKIETALSKWNYMYPEMGSIEAAAVWADHLKCRKDSDYCDGLSFFDSLEVFNQWHFVDYAYIANNFNAGCLAVNSPLPKQGAVYILKQFWSTVSVAKKHSCTSDVNCPYHTGNDFTWNLLLRMLIHIFGDMHQPLHAIEGFSAAFPNGDKGGNAIHLGGIFRTFNLHSFFDSIANHYKSSWPHASTKTLQQIADELIAKYESTLEDRVVFNAAKFNIEEVAKETNQLGVRVYEGISFEEVGSHDKLELSDDMVKEYVEMSESQLVLGGIRLAEALEYVANVLPYEETRVSATLEVKQLMTYIPLTLAVFITIVILVGIVLSRKGFDCVKHQSERVEIRPETELIGN